MSTGKKSTEKISKSLLIKENPFFRAYAAHFAAIDGGTEALSLDEAGIRQLIKLNILGSRADINTLLACYPLTRN